MLCTLVGDYARIWSRQYQGDAPHQIMEKLATISELGWLSTAVSPLGWGGFKKICYSRFGLVVIAGATAMAAWRVSSLALSTLVTRQYLASIDSVEPPTAPTDDDDSEDEETDLAPLLADPVTAKPLDRARKHIDWYTKKREYRSKTREFARKECIADCVLHVKNLVGTPTLTSANTLMVRNMVTRFIKTNYPQYDNRMIHQVLEPAIQLAFIRTDAEIQAEHILHSAQYWLRKKQAQG